MSGRFIFVVVAALLMVAACSVEVAQFDPTEQVGADIEDFAPPTTELPVTTSSTVPGPSIRTVAPRFVIDGFDPELGALEQLPPIPGAVVTVLGPEVGAAQASLELAFREFTEVTGIEVEYTGTLDAEVVLDELLAGDDPPDVAIIPQPGRIQRLIERGALVPAPELVRRQAAVGFDPFWRELASRDGRLYGIPLSANVKSLVWYQPRVFAERGYAVPTTFAGFEALVERIRMDGLTPWCIGIASGGASGWPLTDWLEDYLLRLEGPAFYDQWVDHEVPFNDPRVVAALERVGAMWFTPGNVNGGRSAIDSTPYQQAAIDHLDGDCVLHRQASFIAAEYAAAGATLGPGGDVDLFYLPTVDDRFGQVVLGAGAMAVALDETAATWSLMSYIASPDFPNNRIRSGSGGYLSAHLLHDTGAYRSPADQRIAEILVGAEVFRFDGSDLMPAEIGSNVLWRTATVYTGGTITAWDLVDEVEAVWPE